MSPESTESKAIVIGPGLRLDEDGETLIAERPGRFHFDGQSVSIRQAEEVSGGALVSGSPHDCAGDLLIDGNVREGAKVDAAGTIIVKGSVEPSCLSAGRDIVVTQGVVGRSKGRVVAGGDVVIKYGEDASIKAGQDLVIHTNLANCEVSVAGRILASTATLIGGKISAGRLVDAGQIGSESTVATEVRVGHDTEDPDWIPQCESWIDECREMTKRLDACASKSSDRLRADGMANPSAPSGIERMIVRLEHAASRLDCLITRTRSAQNETKFIRAAADIHEGSVLTVENLTFRVRETLKGPVRVELQKVRNATEMVAVYEKTDSINVLKAKGIGDGG